MIASYGIWDCIANNDFLREKPPQEVSVVPKTMRMQETPCTIQGCSCEPQKQSKRNRSNHHDDHRAFGVKLRGLRAIWTCFFKKGVWIKSLCSATQNLFQWQHRTSNIILTKMAPNLNSDEYYQILGVPRSASDAQIKKAYKKLAVKVCFWLSSVHT